MVIRTIVMSVRLSIQQRIELNVSRRENQGVRISCESVWEWWTLCVSSSPSSSFETLGWATYSCLWLIEKERKGRNINDDCLVYVCLCYSQTIYTLNLFLPSLLVNHSQLVLSHFRYWRKKLIHWELCSSFWSKFPLFRWISLHVRSISSRIPTPIFFPRSWRIERITMKVFPSMLHLLPNVPSPINWSIMSKRPNISFHAVFSHFQRPSMKPVRAKFFEIGRSNIQENEVRRDKPQPLILMIGWWL